MEGFPSTTSNKWFAHYLNFIFYRKQRLDISQRRKKYASELLGYCEWHHIIPRCLGGKDTQENGVWLTGREHFIAHQMLFKSFRNVNGLGVAFSFMAEKCNNGTLYQWMRTELAKQQSVRGKKNLGKKFTEEHKNNLSKSLSGRIFSEETKAKLSEKAKQRKLSPEAKEKKSQQMKEWHQNNLHPMSGKKHSEETKERISKSTSGENNAMSKENRIRRATSSSPE